MTDLGLILCKKSQLAEQNRLNLPNFEEKFAQFKKSSIFAPNLIKWLMENYNNV